MFGYTGDGPAFFVGLMSGTSADGIDAVVARLWRERGRLKAIVESHVRRPFAPTLRNQILHTCLHGTVAEICELNFLLGEGFAQAALAVIRKSKLKPGAIAAIGSHGQTIHHLPNAPTPSTLQIGEPAVIAERTGITTIADFRVRDMAAGGQGAPLVPFADWALFTDGSRPRVVQNIGGIGNLTFLPPRAKLKEVVAFDTGPGNMIIDGVVSALSKGKETYDRKGQWAARGIVSTKLLAELMAHPFLKKRPPKTTGREEFGEPFVQRILTQCRRLRLRPEDMVATVTAFTAASVVQSYKRFIFPKLPVIEGNKLQVILGGGGAKNPTLRRMLKERVAGADFFTHENFGIANAAKEALAFAILAYETLAGRPGNVPRATGAKKAVVLGKIIPGEK
jgi:anhydro-N-acetylmuramic acid kinase